MGSHIRTVLLGLAQASATVFYSGIAVKAVAQLQKWEPPTDGYLSDLALLLLFVVSALVSGALILGYPGYLILHQKSEGGFWLLLSTIVWLILILAGVIAT